MAKNFALNIKLIEDKAGQIDESKVTIEKEPMMFVFGDHGQNLPADAVKGIASLQHIFETTPREPATK